jgi:choline dehydrogenase-like flavoprotein
MTRDQSDVVIIGSGVAGTLVARALLGAGRTVTMVERGGMKSHDEQIRDGRHSTGSPLAEANHETAPGAPAYPWEYVHGVGGSTLHWHGAAPRFQESDFRMRSTFGVMVDWPFGLAELVADYDEAERLLGVAGGDGGAMPPHPFTPSDLLMASVLGPLRPLPQARPTRPVGARPACCGATTCGLCPVDARFSVLNGLAEVLDHPRLTLRTETVAERVVVGSRRRVTAVRCTGVDGRRFDLEPRLVVAAGGGFENPALLLRSGLERTDVGRFLYDHAHRTLWIRLRKRVGAGRGGSVSTGSLEAFRDGSFRTSRSAAAINIHNPGLPVHEEVANAVLGGGHGSDIHREAVDRWRRTIVLNVMLEDVPRDDRRVTLSASRDVVGLPLVRVDYGRPSRYEAGGWEAVKADIARRVAPLGVEAVEEQPGPLGGHLLGTCRIGGVVDADQRHLDVENLYVTGGSAFPTYSPIHPTLTIAALAVRLGRHLSTGG